jgi:hypothetical protein
MMAWSRWSVSAASIRGGLSVKIAWWRQAGSSSPCCGGAAERAHDQPGGHRMFLAGERGVGHFDDLGVGDPALLVLADPAIARASLGSIRAGGAGGGDRLGGERLGPARGVRRPPLGAVSHSGRCYRLGPASQLGEVWSRSGLQVPGQES